HTVFRLDNARPKFTLSSCIVDCHHLLNILYLAADRLFELALDLVRVLEADVSGDLGHDVRVDAVVPVAQLDVDAPLHLRVGFNDLAHPRRQLSPSGGDVLTWYVLSLLAFEVDVNTHHLGEQRP